MTELSSTWSPVPLGSALNAPPSTPAHAPVLGKLELLPFNDLSWEDFERLLWRVMRDVEGLRHAQLYGEKGQAQQGIDIVALESDGTGVALQSKKYQSFFASNLKTAISRFRTTKRPFEVDRLIVAVARSVKSTGVVTELATQRKSVSPLALDFWDAQELSTLLRDRADIVIEFFGEPTAQAFCLPFKIDVSVIPSVQEVAVREALARTPEAATGADVFFAAAAEIADSDPESALQQLESGQARLRDAGFGPHAALQDKERIRLLAAADRADEAAEYVLDSFWTALDLGLSVTAQLSQARFTELMELVPDSPEVQLCQKVSNAAMMLYQNPLADPPEINSLLVGRPQDRACLLLLAGETALANEDRSWLALAKSSMEAVSLDPAVDRIYRVRLRLLVAEVSDDWAPLLSDARRLQLGHDLLALVTARFARHCALNERFEEADLAWDEASGAASLARQWQEASTWVFSRRAFRSRWNPFTSDQLLPLQTALRDMGNSAPLVTTDTHAYEDALASLREGRLRPAAIAAQRALRDAVTISDWAGEDRARRVLASVMIAADEPAIAAKHLARSGDTKAVVELADEQPLRFIDVIEELGASNYWTVGTTFRMLAAQADLIPDDRIGDVIERAIFEILPPKDGVRPDIRSFATSRYGNALKAIAGVAPRLSLESAEIVMKHFEAQPPVDVDHHRYHDEDEATAVAQIAHRHAALADRAIEHLVSLLGRSQTSRTSSNQRVVDDNRKTAEPFLRKLADAGNPWAQETLAVEDESAVDPGSARGALERLREPLEHVEGVFSTGTNAVGDSLLIRGLPEPDVVAAFDELIRRADDPHIGSSDRGEYLIAATNLVPALSVPERRARLEHVVRLAQAPTPSAHDEMNSRFTHKLGSFRMSGATRTSSGQAIALAAALVEEADQRTRVKLIAYSMLGGESDYWLTRALQFLDESVDGDLSFLASQGWAVRSLAALRWVEHGEPAHLGARLATDADVRVRRTLARQLAADATNRHADVKQILAEDPAYSVRSEMGNAARSDSEVSQPSQEPDLSDLIVRR